MSDISTVGHRGVIIPALIAALAVIGTQFLIAPNEARKTDAEFARIALTILSADAEKQNHTARRVAIDLLAKTLPIRMSQSDKESWLIEGPVLLSDMEVAKFMIRQTSSTDRAIQNLSEALGPLIERPFKPINDPQRGVLPNNSYKDSVDKFQGLLNSLDLDGQRPIYENLGAIENHKELMDQ